MFVYLCGQSPKTVSINHNFLKRKETRSGPNRGPSAYQYSALPLGHTGPRLYTVTLGLMFTRGQPSVSYGHSYTRTVMLDVMLLSNHWKLPIGYTMYSDV